VARHPARQLDVDGVESAVLQVVFHCRRVSTDWYYLVDRGMRRSQPQP
jgi:hypothetical protein